MKRDLKSDFLPLAIGFFSGVGSVLLILDFQGYLSSWHLDEPQSRLWEIVLKAVAGLLAISGAIVAVLKYFDDKNAASLISQREIRKDFLVKRQEVYWRLLRAVGKIVNLDPDDGEKWVAVQSEFFETYWGELQTVWSENVKQAATSYSSLLISLKSGDRVGKADLARRGGVVGQACRESLGSGWNFENSGEQQSGD